MSFALLPGKKQGQAATTNTPVQVNLLMVEEGFGGEATFVSRAKSRGAKPLVQDKGDDSEASEPFVAKLALPILDGQGASSANVTNPVAGASSSVSGNGDSYGHGNGSGREGDTSFFQIAARGQRVVYVIDGSSSMGKNGAWLAARGELNRSVQCLPEGAQFQIIVYNSRAHFLLPRFADWLSFTPESFAEVSAALSKIFPEGTTDHGPALRKALALRPDTIFFLTDADDLKQEHLYLASQLNKGRAVIHTFEMTLANRQRPGMPLQLLAGHNRGVYQAVSLAGYSGR